MHRRWPKRAAWLVLVLLTALRAAALDISNWCQHCAPELEVEVRSHSGSPLLLEFLIDDPQRTVQRVTVDSEQSSAAFSLSHSDMIDLKLTPFQQPNVHGLVLGLETRCGVFRRELTVGFTDFVWGRDNFRFSNALSQHGSVRPYSRVLFPWAEERFGTLNPEERSLLLRAAYDFFGETIGRCYAFTGSQIRYRRDPQLLPSYYSSIYDIREQHRTVQDQMNMLQNDIVFDRFITRAYDTAAPQTDEQLRRELSTIKAEIAAGRPAAFGYLSPQRHHSMLAYGYIEDEISNRITLIAANNWGDELSHNVFSKGAVRIAIDLDRQREGDRIRWLDTTIREYQTAEHLFFVDVKQEYRHDRELLSALFSEERRRLRREERTVVVVEQAADATLEDGDRVKAGRMGRRTLSELDGVVYTRVENAHIFEFPSALELELRVTRLDDPTEAADTPAVSIYIAAYRSGEPDKGSYSAIYESVAVAEDEPYTLRLTPADWLE